MFFFSGSNLLDCQQFKSENSPVSILSNKSLDYGRRNSYSDIGKIAVVYFFFFIFICDTLIFIIMLKNICVDVVCENYVARIPEENASNHSQPLTD